MSDPLRRVTGLSLDAFAASHWGVAPLLRRAAQLPSGFDDLLSFEAVDELIARRGLRTPFVRMSIDGTVVPASRYTRGGGAGAEIGDQIADDRVLAEFAAGATLVLQGLHRTWSPMREFARALCEQLGHPVQVNAYVTPPQNQGFAPHYDVHDVFVLQFGGRKRWRVHEPVLTAPRRDQPWDERKAAVTARAAESPLLETVLDCGDALYLPRGYIHSATSLGEIAGHLTIGVHPLTRRTLADHIFRALGDDAALRRALPLGGDLSGEAAFGEDLDATIATLQHALSRLDRAAVARGIGHDLAMATRPAALAPLAQWSAAAALTATGRVRLRAGLRISLQTDGDSTHLDLADARIDVPPFAAEAARVVLTGDAVCAAQLFPGDVERGMTFLARLLREGIVSPV